MKSLILLALAPILALGGGCQPAVRSPYDMQQKFYSTFRSPGLAADQALRSAHYFKIAERRDLALRELSAAVALEPHNTRLLNALGACYDEFGDHATAQQIFNQSLSLDPDNAGALNNLGYSYYLAGNFEQSEAALQAALAKDPKNKRAQNNLGMVLCRIGKNDRALSLWQQQDGETQARDKLARVMASLGKPLAGDGAKSTSSSEIMLTASSTRTDRPPRREDRSPDLPGSNRPQTPERVLTQAPLPPSTVKSGEASAKIILPLEIIAKNSPQGDMTESVSPASGALRAEKPSTYSRTKIITVAAEKDQRSVGQGEEQIVPGMIENCHLLAQSREEKRPVPPRLVVKSAIPDANQTETCNLEIRNGVGARNLAKNMRRLLKQYGYNVAIARNHIDFGAPETVVYFRPDQEKVAKQINDRFLKANRLERKENLHPGIDVKIVLGHDLFQNNQNLAPFQASRLKPLLGPELALNFKNP
jgi:hypothetical protein